MRLQGLSLLFPAASVAVPDDEVKLKNGDRMTGTLKGLAGVITDYRRKPSPAFKRQDDRYVIGLGYKF